MHDNVLFIIENLNHGGAERVTALIANQFAILNRHNVYIAVMNRSKEEYHTSRFVKKIYQEKHSRKKAIELVYEYLFLKRVIRNIRPISVISLSTYRTNIILGLVSIKRNYKLIFSERNDPRQYPSRRVLQILRNITYYFSDGVVFQTEDAKRVFEDKLHNKSVVIPNPIYIDNSMVQNDKRSKRIVNCSRLEPQKNIDMLIEAFSVIGMKYKEYTLDIYGDGSLERELKEKASQLTVGERIRFHGYVANVLDEIKDAEIYVSTSNFEGISNSMLEAMALGITTICTDCPIGGARMVIRDRYNGLLIPVNDTEAVVRALEEVIDNRNFSLFLSSNGKRVVKTYSIEKIADRWSAFLEA